MRLAFGVGVTDVGYTGGVADGADGGLSSAAFLAAYGPYGMVMDFTDASITIDDSTDVLDYSSQGTVSSTTGALLGPGSKLTNTAPSLKNTEQADGYTYFQAHNLYLNSASPANQSITVVSGASYAVTITGSVSVTASGAATGTWTAGTNTFTAATTTLTLGSTSGSGTVHVRRTPSVSTYVATAGAAVYDLPYVYSGGELAGVMVEPAATNLCLRSNDFTNASWTKSNMTTALTATGPDGVANSASTLTATAGNATALQAITSGSSSRLTHCYIKRRTGTGNIDLTQDNGSTWATVTVTSAWTRVEIAAVTSTNPTVGIRIVTSGDAVDVAYFQHETGTVATSPIITYGSSVVRAVDNDSIAQSLFPALGSDCTIFVEATPYAGTSSSVYALQLYTNGSNFAALRSDSGTTAQAVVFTSGALVASPSVTNWTAGAQKKVALRLSTNNTNICSGGTLGTNDTSCAMPTHTTLFVGSNNGVNNLGGIIHRIAAFPRGFSESELQAVST